jgi:hypothetical protein
MQARFQLGRFCHRVHETALDSASIAAECLMAPVWFEVFGGVASDQPGKTGQYGSDGKFDYSDHD